MANPKGEKNSIPKRSHAYDASGSLHLVYVYGKKMQLNIPYHGCCVDMILRFVGSLFDSKNKTRHTLFLLEPFVCIQFPGGVSAHNYRQNKEFRLTSYPYQTIHENGIFTYVKTICTSTKCIYMDGMGYNLNC